MWFGLFIAILNAFFHTGRSCALFASVSCTLTIVALRLLWGLPLPLKPSFSKWVYLCIRLSLLSTCQYHLRRFNLSFDYKGAKIQSSRHYSHAHIALSFILNIQHSIPCSFCKRCCTSLCRDQHLLAWSKVSLMQLSHNFSAFGKKIVVDVRRRRRSSLQNTAMLLWFMQLWLAHSHFQGRFCHQRFVKVYLMIGIQEWKEILFWVFKENSYYTQNVLIYLRPTINI